MSKIIVANSAPVSAGQPGSVYIGVVTHTFAGAGSWAPPAGVYDILPNADITIQGYVNGAFVPLQPATQGAEDVRCDGASMELTASAACTATLLQRE